MVNSQRHHMLTTQLNVMRWIVLYQGVFIHLSLFYDGLYNILFIFVLIQS